MSEKTKCPLTISDWFLYLNARASERANFLFARKTFDLSKIMIKIATVTIAFIGIISAITLLEATKWEKYIGIMFFIVIFIIFIKTEKNRGEKEFREYENKSKEFTVSIDTIITKIMDDVLKTSEQIRDEWKKTIEEYAKKYP